MNEKLIEEKLLNLFKNVFKIEDIESIKSIQINTYTDWDSINHIKMIMNLENEFKIEIPEQDYEILYDYNNIKLYLSSSLID